MPPPEVEFEQIRYEVDGPAATIEMHRPDKLNAFTVTMQREMNAAIDLAEADPDVRGIIVTGSGRAFCAGADLSAGRDTFDADSDIAKAAAKAAPRSGSRHDNDDAPAERTYPRDFGGRLTLRIFECTKPVIAAINGPAVGIGATMTLPMDIRLASETARFGFVFAGRGIVPEAASSWFLPRIVGISRALEWCYSTRVFPVEEAFEGGLVRSVLPADELLPAARAIVDELAAKAAPVSIALIRQMMWRMLGADHPMAAHRIDSRGVYSTGRSADAREGVVAFLEKREPHWTLSPATDMPEWFPWWDDQPYS